MPAVGRPWPSDDYYDNDDDDDKNLLQNIDGHVEVVIFHRWRRVDRGKRRSVDQDQNHIYI